MKEKTERLEKLMEKLNSMKEGENVFGRGNVSFVNLDPQTHNNLTIFARLNGALNIKRASWGYAVYDEEQSYLVFLFKSLWLRRR